MSLDESDCRKEIQMYTQQAIKGRDEVCIFYTGYHFFVPHRLGFPHFAGPVPDDTFYLVIYQSICVFNRMQLS